MIPTSDAVDARLQVRVPVKAGPRVVTVAFIERPAVQDTQASRAVPAHLVRTVRITRAGRTSRR